MSTTSDPGRQMALLQTGDWWEYTVEGSATRDGRTIALRGEVRVAIERREAGGRLRDAIAFMPNHRIVGVDGPAGVFPMPMGMFYFEQDPTTRAVSITGDNMGPGGSDRFAHAPQVRIDVASMAKRAVTNRANEEAQKALKKGLGGLFKR